MIGRAVAFAVVAVTASACGGSTESRAPGFVPVKTVASTSPTTFVMPSSAMEPTIHCGRPGHGCEADIPDRLVVRKPVSAVRRADVVLVQTPALARLECGAAGRFVERVIGMPGDRWEQRQGYVYVDGKKLKEAYVRPQARDSQTLTLADIPPRGRMTRIPARKYLVMGDNRSSSCDSRRWGLVQRASIIAKVVEIQRPSSG